MLGRQWTHTRVVSWEVRSIWALKHFWFNGLSGLILAMYWKLKGSYNTVYLNCSTLTFALTCEWGNRGMGNYLYVRLQRNLLIANILKLARLHTFASIGVWLYLSYSVANNIHAYCNKSIFTKLTDAQSEFWLCPHPYRDSKPAYRNSMMIMVVAIRLSNYVGILITENIILRFKI